MNNKINPRWMKVRQAAHYSGIGRDRLKYHGQNPTNWSYMAHYSGIGRDRLKALADAGEVKGFQDPDSGRGDWVFDRLSLDVYRETQDSRIHQRALEFVKRHFDAD